jgi:hypothetical protein
MLWGKIREAFSHGLLSHELLKKANKLGISIDLFYLVSEGNFSCSPEWLESFKDYELCVLNRDDMELIALDHPWDSIDGLRARVDKGHICIGLRYEDDIVAFTWADLKECNHVPLRFDMADDEAYLYDAFTMPRFRGKGLAPYMRYQSYQHLRSIGRDRYYSISQYFNTSSVQFKQKLNAGFDKLFLSVSRKSGKPHTFQLR